jgi:HD-GYP domain-containing protein (c-di-GMP phosphodiesterase class II)
MRNPQHRRLAGTGAVALALGIPLVLFTVLRAFPGLDPLLESPTFHVIVVSAIAGCALLVALVAGVVAIRIRRHEVVFLAAGCLAVGVLLLGHGLLTPGIGGQPFSHWIGRLPTLAIASFATALAATLLRPGNPIARFVARHAASVLVTWGLALMLLAVALVNAPLSFSGHHPVRYESRLSEFALGASASVLAVTAAVYLKRARLGRDSVQYALSLAAGMCVSACLSLQFGRLWRLSWWDYHVYLLIGFGAAVFAIARERSRGVEATMRPVVTRDPFEQIANKYTESLRPLVAAVEAKDFHTHGHSARTAELATRLGHRLRLDAQQLRAVAEGSYLHDIGKIATPDAILNKRGPLDEIERQVIERHPIDGYDIAKRATSLAHALPIIRFHHERWDGRGYPDGLAGQGIPLVARVAAVADVWDALTSVRAYRTAWSEQEALAHILAGRGSHFDPAVVDVLVSMLGDDGVRPRARGGESAEVHSAVEVCHHQTEAH